MRRINHGLRIFIIWLVASVIADILVGILPIPSPVGSTQAFGEHQTLYMLFYVGMPIFVFVWVFLLYSLIVFRHRPGEEVVERESPPDSTPVLLLWAGFSFTVVLFLAGWGTFTLKEITQANGPHPLVVQVIGQQWQWTFRYPSYGAMETKSLEVPVSTPIRFDITSLDVVHSFWIYDYDIKEDAVPGVVNHAYFDARYTGSSTARGKNWVTCNELCGLWHGWMRSRLAVVSKPAFASWAANQERFERSTGVLQKLPKYSDTYFPPPVSPPAPQDQSP
ncbi:MAG: cytochrome c oxidase subunit II [Chloroflexota bacterium]|nr:MAG: hypothetical protein DLM70_14795 [Chloroflexota bacterium]